MQNRFYLWKLLSPHRWVLAALVLVALLLVLMEGVGLGLVLVLLGAGGSVGGTLAQYPSLAGLLRHIHSLPINDRILLAAATLLGTVLLRGTLQYSYHLLTVRLRRRVETPLQQQVFERF